jgi:hypothetical protein
MKPATLPPQQPPHGFLTDVHSATAHRRPGMLGLLKRESLPYSWHEAAAAAVDAERTNLAIPQRWNHAILFTGHMIDAPTRPQPRFPASAEPAAREAILDNLQTLLATKSSPTIAIAGAASGGDLLFHECCAFLAIPSLVRLTLPPADYLAASVAPAGASWVTRFHALLDRVGPTSVEILGDSEALPAWLGPRPDYDVWQRTNLWLVEEAAAAAPHRSLLALWDGKSGDGPGGTQHLVQAAPDLGICNVRIIPVSSIVAGAQST